MSGSTDRGAGGAAGRVGSARGGRLRVSVDGVGKVFPGDIEALRGISLDVAPGGFTAIVGASGCGKTTLLRIIGGLAHADSGLVRFRDEGGAPVTPGPFDIGFCFQEPRLLPWRSVLNNVALGLELAGVGAAERRERAMQALELVHLGDRAAALPAALSGGMRMRAALARALVTRPRLLLLDEPFSALDEVTRQQLDDELLRIRAATGATILLVTHAISEAVYLAERVVVLSRGPGRVMEIVEVTLPADGRERRASPGMASLSARILESINANRAERAA